MVAARYLGVPPWELYEQPMCWLHWAVTASSAEAEARKVREQQGQEST